MSHEVTFFHPPKRPNGGGTVYQRPADSGGTEVKDVEGRSAPHLLAQGSELGKERELRTVRPGWWVQAYDGGKAEWLKVYYAAWGTHTPTQQKATRVLARNAAGESCEIFEQSSNLVRCCTKAEAKKAGLS